MRICFTREELQEMSHRKRRSAVIAWLRARNVPFIPDADGWPSVLRTAILDAEKASPQESEPELNFS